MSKHMLLFNRMSVEIESYYWRVRNWVMRAWIPWFLNLIGDLAIFLGLASESAKAIQRQEVQKKRMLCAPTKWEGTRAYNINTLEIVGCIRRFYVPYMGSFLVSTGVFDKGFSKIVSAHNKGLFFEHSLDNRLHVVNSEHFKVPDFAGVKKRVRTVVYAHIATYYSKDKHSLEIYRSRDLSSFINERIWTCNVYGIGVRTLTASAAVHGLFDRREIPEIPDNPIFVADLRLVVILDDLSELIFRNDDLVHFS